MHRHTTILEAPDVRLDHYTPNGQFATMFAAFKFGTRDDRMTVHLTVEQVAALAAQFTDAVAAFRACGALPDAEASA